MRTKTNKKKSMSHLCSAVASGGAIFISVLSCSALVCAAVAPAGSMTDSDRDWAELWPIERGGVQLIEFMSEYFLSCRLSGGTLSCIHLQHPSHCKSQWVSPDSAFSVVATESAISLAWAPRDFPARDREQSSITAFRIRQYTVMNENKRINEF